MENNNLAAENEFDVTVAAEQTLVEESTDSAKVIIAGMKEESFDIYMQDSDIQLESLMFKKLREKRSVA